MLFSPDILPCYRTLWCLFYAREITTKMSTSCRMGLRLTLDVQSERSSTKSFPNDGLGAAVPSAGPQEAMTWLPWTFFSGGTWKIWCSEESLGTWKIFGSSSRMHSRPSATTRTCVVVHAVQCQNACRPVVIRMVYSSNTCYECVLFNFTFSSFSHWLVLINDLSFTTSVQLIKSYVE